MIHDALRDSWTITTLPDAKRSYAQRRWRKVRHLAALRSRIEALREVEGVFVWDDLSLLWFTSAMRRRTIFIFHHYEPLQFDSAPLEPLLWRRLFTALQECHTVVCVSPYWATFLADRGITATTVPNAVDLAPIDAVLSENRGALREQLGLPTNRTLVYVGKAVHWKGTELACSLLAEQDFCLVSTGNNTVDAPTHHLGFLSYVDHLRAIRACDVGLFLPQLHEGWSRCAAEAILLGLPCVTHHIAGLGDLSRLTYQPAADLPQLANQLRVRLRTPAAAIARSRVALTEHSSTSAFTERWRHLVASVTPASTKSAPLVDDTPLT